MARFPRLVMMKFAVCSFHSYVVVGIQRRNANGATRAPTRNDQRPVLLDCGRNAAKFSPEGDFRSVLSDVLLEQGVRANLERKGPRRFYAKGKKQRNKSGMIIDASRPTARMQTVPIAAASQ